MTALESTTAPADVNPPIEPHPLSPAWWVERHCPEHGFDLGMIGDPHDLARCRLHCALCETDDVLLAALEAASAREHQAELEEWGETLEDFVVDTGPEYDWVVEGLLERRDRVILTGPEKAGKSTLLRQIAVRIGAGWHPFEPVQLREPALVTVVDTENNRGDLRRKFRPLLEMTRELGDVAPHQTLLVSKPEGIDLRRPAALRWLDDVTERAGGRVDVLVIGPAYKLGRGDPSSEEVAREVTGALDDFRTRHNCAVLLEHHTPHAGPNGRRPHRPIGSSLWGRWCEVALHLSAQGVLSRWQPMRDERAWPQKLNRGETWPWVAATSASEVAWGRIVGLIEEHGCLGQRAMSEHLEMPKTSLQRILKAHAEEWAELCGSEAA